LPLQQKILIFLPSKKSVRKIVPIKISFAKKTFDRRVLDFPGAETTVYESRPYMDRNNVLKLWTFVMEDLKSLGAKKFCPNLGKQGIFY
jgi:hypothetical protein